MLYWFTTGSYGSGGFDAVGEVFGQRVEPFGAQSVTKFSSAKRCRALSPAEKLLMGVIGLRISLCWRATPR
ncbi:MAG: hypothetical protein IPK28_15460 [Devosia sp.]|nr:hypothetical protein [Devosia sp.]